MLENILKLNQTFHPVIYLRKVKYRDLQNLLNFIYQGEANVSEEDLNNFPENISQVEDNIYLKTSHPSGIDNYNEDFVEIFFDNDIDTKPLIVPECKKNNQESFVYKEENIISTNEVQNIEGRYPCGQCEYKGKWGFASRGFA